MGIAKDGNISLRQIREDVGLSPNGSARETAVLHKVLKTGGSVAMSEYRGNIHGMQLTQDKTTLQYADPWNPKLYNHQVVRFGSNQGEAYVSGNKVVLRSKQMDWDQGPEMRMEGTVLEAGTYRFTCTVKVPADNRQNAQTHVAVVANAGGWLSGAQALLVNKVFTGYQTYEQGVNETLTLTTDKPYITLIGRAINKGSTNNYDQWYSSEFWGYKLVKI